MDVDSEEECGFWEVLEENGHFESTFKKYSDVKSFLNRQERIYARSVSAEEADQDVFFKFETDVDGCVVELKSLNGFTSPVRHLTLLPGGKLSVRHIYSMLKKHVNLPLYSNAKLTNLRQSVGIQLFLEQDWECWLGVVPCLDRPGQVLEEGVVINLSFDYLETVRKVFQRKLCEFASSGTAMKTLMKNDITNPRRIFVLPDDSGSILRGLQESIVEASTPSDFQPILFCFRFGDKSRGGISLQNFKACDIRSITVHSAVDISSEFMHLFWSSCGLQSLASRGTIGTCLSFSDCGNFQSNLDGRLLDVSKDLRSLCHHSGNIRFIQLYSDLPHRRPETRFHPVSGCIACGNVLPGQTAEAFKRDAETYISALENNFHLLTKGTCRMEFVTELTDIPEHVRACDCLDTTKLRELLIKTPLLVPFPEGAMPCVQQIGLCLVNELKNLLAQFQSTGNVEATWQAFQYELAAEKMLWGHPFCYRSQQLSVNLGPGKLEPSRCLTDYLGFLALELPTSCMSDEDSIPPGRIWTSSEQTARRISRFAGIHDIQDGGSFVLGRRLVDVLLGDLIEVGKLDRSMRLEDLKRELCSEKPKTVSVTGSVTIKQLVCVLCNQQRRLPVCMIYGCACRMILKSGKDLVVLLKDGLAGCNYFPAVRVYDNHRNPTLSWSLQAGAWKIIGQEEGASAVQDACTMSSLVTSELELRRIVYVSKLKQVPRLFPWIVPCTRKLSALRLSEEGLLLVLCFVTCVALLMNGWYVEYAELEKLMSEMNVPQSRLRTMEVLSKLQLAHFNKFRLHRLHHSIPFKLNGLDAKSVSNEQKQANVTSFEPIVAEGPGNRITEDDIQTIPDLAMTCRPPACVPEVGGRTLRWTPEELELLHEVSMDRKDSDTQGSLYDLFKKRCMQKGISFRTFSAFKHKLSAMVVFKG